MHWIIRVKLGFTVLMELWVGINFLVFQFWTCYSAERFERIRSSCQIDQSEQCESKCIYNSTSICLVSITDSWNSILIHYWCLVYSDMYLLLLNFVCTRRKTHYHCDGLLPRLSSIWSFRFNQSELGPSFLFWLGRVLWQLYESKWKKRMISHPSPVSILYAPM